MRAPEYTWNCLACGHANAAGTGTCGDCACPAIAGGRQIRQFRARHIKAGGMVGAGAALEPDGISPWKALWWLVWLPFGLVLGYVPIPDWRDPDW